MYPSWKFVPQNEISHGVRMLLNFDTNIAPYYLRAVSGGRHEIMRIGERDHNYLNNDISWYIHAA